MRIAVVHSYYSAKQPSGENIAVDAQVKVLREAGHQVLLVAQHTDDRERSRTYPLEAAWTVATGRGQSPRGALDSYQPDVVHVHNLFPNWGTEWLTTWSGPLVATLHNYRPLCAAGTLFRDGQTCTLCPDGDRWAALRHRCYRGSTVATAPLAWRGRRGARADPVLRRADRLIVLSGRSAKTYADNGIEPNRMTILTNFIEDPYAGRTPTTKRDKGWVFVGRLSEEKGIGELLSNWPVTARLDVIGDGPIRRELRRAVGSNVTFLGQRSRTQTLAALPDYSGLVIPSRCQEGLPTVLLEAWAAGLPVAALAGSSAADFVQDSGAGTVVLTDIDWANALEVIQTHWDQMSTLARSAYEAHFRPASWVHAIGKIYSAAVVAPSPS